ncbi:MAG TPA: aldolase, partial [Jiangellales bacterium]|nr:aldolase [Jiangellales bacterium]
MDRPRLGDDDLAEVDALLADADAGVSAASGGGILGRQPVHTLYVPADRVRARHAATCGEEALDAVFRHAPDPVTLGRVTGLDRQLLWEVFPRLFRKLHEEPVEDLRIDLEDGYGLRPDDVEDAHVATSVTALLNRPDQAPPRWGVRIKSLEPSTRRRGLRSLDLAIGAVLDAGPLPDGFTV